MANYVTLTSNKKKWTAFWLCFIGGMVGLHYFYVGRIGRAFLCMFTLNFFMFGWIFDLIKIMSGKFTDNTGMYLRA